MNLKQAYEQFGWPKPKDITQPQGEGPSIFSQGVSCKIGKNLLPVDENGAETGVKTGALFANPDADRTEPPLAIICEFSRHVNEDTLLETHRLAWNFARSPLLITLEPSRVLAWSCSVRPSNDSNATFLQKLTGKLVSCEITRRNDPLASFGLEESASNALSWVNLLAGSHFRTHPEYFKASERLDATLVNNLLCVRNELRDRLALKESRCHDLLARLIFIQFLFQRKDSEGHPALHASKLRKLTDDGVLRNRHDTLESLLGDYKDAYAFFYWLNEHFNGDLFPGKAATPQDREKEWAEEKKDVKPCHLQSLADFIGGKIDLSNGQGLLWKQYAFDTIPLELISSIYEVFVGPPEKNKSYYTSGHLVDFMLDAVLPWKSKNSQLRVLDPACGSGIFLVKAFQRLVYRWRQKNNSDPKPSDLKNILKNQIYGVDLNPEAVRVASFSLYLAMCDELDPRQYWTKEKLFPLMRDCNLMGVDFFSEDSPCLHTKEDAKTFDLIIGNAPWGKGSAKPSSENVRKWAKTHHWIIPGQDLGPMFLAKAAHLIKSDGWISMIQPAGLLLNRTGPVRKFRRNLLASFELEEIVNLAAVRRVIFSNAIGPACIVTFKPKVPTGTNDFAYITPKPQGTAEDALKVVIEPHDVHFVSQQEAANNDFVWTGLMWGGRRDLELVRRMGKYETIGSLKEKNILATREGVIRGDQGREQNVILNRRFLYEKSFPEKAFFELDSQKLEINKNPKTDSAASVDFTAFDPPQLLFKQSWNAEQNRFRAVLVKPDKSQRGALCSDSYVSIRDLTGSYQTLYGLWLLLNSSFAPYWFKMTGGKFAGFVPVATENELRQIPIVTLPKSELQSIAKQGYPAIDREIAARLGLSESENILLEDLHQIVLPDAQRRKGRPPGFEPVTNQQLQSYAATFVKVLSSTFGKEKNFSATVYKTDSTDVIPTRLIAIRIGIKNSKIVDSKTIESDALRSLLRKCNEQFFCSTEKQISFRRVVDVLIQDDKASGDIYTLYLVRPNQRRYWLRSLALRDADRLGLLINHSK